MNTDNILLKHTKISEQSLFIGLTIAYILPIWLFQYFPSQDGPTHLMNCLILKEYNTSIGSIWREYYILNDFTPTQFGHFLLVGLIYIIPPLLAEKLYLTFYILFFLCSFYYYIKSYKEESSFLVFLGFPLIYNNPFQMGFYSFSYSIGMYFIAVGYFIRHRTNFGFKEAIFFALISFVLSLFHIFTLGIAFLHVLVLTIWHMREDFFANPFYKSAKNRWRVLIMNRSWLPIVALLPALILLILFAVGSETTIQTSNLGDVPLMERIKRLMTLDFLVSFDRIEYLWSLLFLLILVFCATCSRKSVLSGGRHDLINGSFVVLLFFTLMFFCLSDSMFGGSATNKRVGLFLIFSSILWLTTRTYPQVIRSWLPYFVFMISLGLLTTLCVKYYWINESLKEYVSAGQYIERDKTLLPLSFAHRGVGFDGKEQSIKVRPFLHASAYIALENHIVEFSNYEAVTGYFPLVFKPNNNPYNQLGNLENTPPQIKSLDFNASSTGKVDYILIWGLQKHFLADTSTLQLIDKIKKKYDHIYTSKKRGLVQLWRRKSFTEHIKPDYPHRNTK